MLFASNEAPLFEWRCTKDSSFPMPLVRCINLGYFPSLSSVNIIGIGFVLRRKSFSKPQAPLFPLSPETPSIFTLSDVAKYEYSSSSESAVTNTSFYSVFVGKDRSTVLPTQEIPCCRSYLSNITMLRYDRLY